VWVSVSKCVGNVLVCLNLKAVINTHCIGGGGGGGGGAGGGSHQQQTRLRVTDSTRMKKRVMTPAFEQNFSHKKTVDRPEGMSDVSRVITTRV